MVTTIDSIITKTTGWKSPKHVAQCTKGINSDVCHAYSNLDFIKARDNNVASTLGDGGVDKTHESPRVYCYDYNFNIPAGATITKVEVRQRRKNNTLCGSSDGIVDTLIKLKVGASITDLGVGNNLSVGAKWSSKNNGLNDYTVGNVDGTVASTWGINVTPAFANYQFFGCVIQCKGMGDTLMQPCIDVVEMQITYTQLGTVSTTVENTNENILKEKNPHSIQCTSELLPTLTDVKGNVVTTKSIDYIYDPMYITLRYRNNVIQREGITLMETVYHNPIYISLTDTLRFQDGSQKKVIGKQKIDADNDEKILEQGYVERLIKIPVYPNKVGGGKVVVDKLHPTQSMTEVSSYVTCVIKEAYTNVSNSLTTISNTVFKNCYATHGTAIYNTGKLTYKDCTFEDITSQDKVIYDYDKYRDGEYR